MIGWLIRIFWGCTSCKFQEVRKIEIYEDEDAKLPCAWKFILRCEKCGRMKSYRF